VPVEAVRATLTLKAYPFRIDILDDQQLIAVIHAVTGATKICLTRTLSAAPRTTAGAFEHARPLRAWRKTWPPVYEQLLTQLRATWPTAVACVNSSRY